MENGIFERMMIYYHNNVESCYGSEVFSFSKTFTFSVYTIECRSGKSIMRSVCSFALFQAAVVINCYYCCCVIRTQLLFMCFVCNYVQGFTSSNNRVCCILATRVKIKPSLPSNSLLPQRMSSIIIINMSERRLIDRRRVNRAIRREVSATQCVKKCSLKL